MKRPRWLMVAAIGALPLLCGFSLSQCGLTARDFEPVSLNGFDPVDNAQDWNDYPWSMAYFVADGAQEGHVYVGTGNGIDDQIWYRMGLLDPSVSPYRPPEIRRYRPDLGPKEWERVFDFRDLEAGPDFTSTGFRGMAVYRAQSDGVNYLYAGTSGTIPSLWRSATGEPGSWEQVFSAGQEGSIRWLAVHNGLLYISIANESVIDYTPGQVWATDGATVWPVIEDGFGNPDNRSVMSLVSYNGWLYAGTTNIATGYEIWKLEGPGKNGTTPVKVVGEGGPDSRNQAAGTPFVFQGKLYYGSQSLHVRWKGFDLIRIDENDQWEVIVGPHSLSGYESGFNRPANCYLWWMEEHDGWLYAGTWDCASLLQYIVENRQLAVQAIPVVVELWNVIHGPSGKAEMKPISVVTEAGADLYKSCDGVHWRPVFTNGLGDPYNYGIRTMVSVGDDLYLGMANPFDGLEIWRGQSCKSTQLPK